MRTPKILDFLRRLARSRRANVAVTFALTLLPISLMVGMGVDIANATRLKLELQDATDAAALGLARQAPLIADWPSPARRTIWSPPATTPAPFR